MNTNDCGNGVTKLLKFTIQMEFMPDVKRKMKRRKN